MNPWQENKCKDQGPLATIHHIRGILSNVGILPLESHWKSSANNFHSVTLSIPDTTLKCNGKGVNQDYALASAYGELMERLQNFAPFRLGMDFDKEAHEAGGFIYAPDEKKVSVDELLADEGWIAKQHHGLNGRKGTLMELWKNISYEKIEGDFIAIPFKNLKDHSLSYIPVKMINKMYMSNGMCAGNTQEEALIQGICEVFERFINRNMVLNRITPPSIPRMDLYNYDSIANMIEDIEASGQYKVVVKDCSLGKGYPVVGVILMDQKNHQYFVKFGSFPKFNLAVERTLTELLQGQDLQQMRGLTPLIKERQGSEHDNLMGILVNGVGVYPKEFLAPGEDYSWAPWENFNGETNHELLKQVVDFTHEKGFEVYARDVSFMGFPSYHVIIPNMSEIEELTEVEALSKYASYNRIKYYLRHLHTLDEESIRYLLQLIELYGFTLTQPVLPLINVQIPVQDMPWYYQSIGMLKLALYLKLERYEHAYTTLHQFLRLTSQGNYKKVPSYFHCLSEYIRLKKEHQSENTIFKTLKDFFQAQLIERVILDFQPEYLFTEKNILTCFDCKECSKKEYCNYPSTRQVYVALKELYNENHLEQKVCFSDLRL